MQKAVFLDRDGVVNIDKHYLYKIEDFEFVDGIIDALAYLQDLGYLLFIITNQSGINRGYYSIEDFDKLTSWMLKYLKSHDITINEVKFCPHTPNGNCNCRKPKIGMIEDIKLHYDIDLQHSYLIGDKDSDIECGYNANIVNTILLSSEYDTDTTKAKWVIDSIKEIKNIIKGK